MRTLYLRNVPDEVVARLERLALLAGTSVNVLAVRELERPPAEPTIRLCSVRCLTSESMPPGSCPICTPKEPGGDPQVIRVTNPCQRGLGVAGRLPSGP